MPSKRYKKPLEVVGAAKAYPLKDAVGVLVKFPKPQNSTKALIWLSASTLILETIGSDGPRCPFRCLMVAVKLIPLLVFAKVVLRPMLPQAASAEFVGFEDMIAKCVSGWSDFDVAVRRRKQWWKFASSVKFSDRGDSCPIRRPAR